MCVDVRVYIVLCIHKYVHILARRFVDTRTNVIPFDTLLTLVESMLTTLSNEVWRLKNVKKLNAPIFSATKRGSVPSL